MIRGWLQGSSDGEEQAACVRCLGEHARGDLDRLLWCPGCRASAVAVASRWGWIAGGVAAAILALWIRLVVQPSELILGGWIAVIAAAFYLAGRIVREIIFGVMRARNRPGVQARPSAKPPVGPGG